MSEIATEVITTIFPFCQHDLLVHVSSVYIGGIGTVWAQKITQGKSKIFTKTLNYIKFQVFCLSFSKIEASKCFSFIHYIWKSLFLQNVQSVLEHLPVL